MEWGGREVRKDAKYGEVFDHHAVEFTYANGEKMFSQSRHIRNCWNSVTEHAIGTKGTSVLSSGTIVPYKGKKYRSKEDRNDPYQTEHDDLFNAVRTNSAYSEAVNGAMSTMTAILGRLATYSGKSLNMADALASKMTIFPKEISWDAKMENAPDADGAYAVAIPGIYKPY